MKVQSFAPPVAATRAQAVRPAVTEQASEAPAGDQVSLTNSNLQSDPAGIAKGVVGGALALAVPTAAGALFGPYAAVGLGVAGAAAGIAFGKASGFITLDFRLPAALILGGGSAALAMAGNAFGGPAVGVAAAAGALGMGLLLAKKH